MSAGGGREEGAAAMLQLLREQPEPQAEESGAQRFALCLPPGEEEVKEVEETIEEMLIRLDEFCGMTDVIRSDTSQILDETIPLIKAKVVEMNNIYAKVDKLEAFVKMVGRHVSFLEEQVLQAEGNHNTVSHAVRKLLQSAAIPSFKNVGKLRHGNVTCLHSHSNSVAELSTLPQHSIHMTCLNSTELKIIFLRTT
ncbi:breast carcinoma-amplified sequence 4 isoform X1 [Caretta caretta]|uniref:breast carcinoma-amplified sequence 4 isoform X1 n=1 Tax=Caretta caretta TaxID=8467 RepID=UPI002095A9C8|nr:breast carcinoma-amplified sequence 4 isoform X1 [Caretta caretta]